MQHQRFWFELFQTGADIARKIETVATLSQADVDQKVLKCRRPGDAVFVREAARRGVCCYRDQLSLFGFTLGDSATIASRKPLIDSSSFAHAAFTRMSNAKIKMRRRISLSISLVQFCTMTGMDDCLRTILNEIDHHKWHRYCSGRGCFSNEI